MANVSLRPATVADEPFLYRLYASTRAEELMATGWDETATTAFLRMQHELRERAYRTGHPSARFDVILVDGGAAGRLSVDRAGRDVHVLDIALLPEHRGHGIGTHLLTALLEEARAAGRPVTLEVERTNRAFGLYARLGFQVVGADEVYETLAWTPPAGDAM